MPKRSRTLLMLLMLLLPSLGCGGGETPLPEDEDQSAQGASGEVVTEFSSGSAEVQEDLPDVDPTAMGFLRVITTLKGERVGNVPFDVQWLEEGNPAKTSSRTAPSGEYTISFEHGSQLVGLVFSSTSTTAPMGVKDGTLIEGKRTHTMEVDLTPSSIVSGVVLDVEGNPMPGAKVLAFFDTPENLETLLNPSVRAFTTADANGKFRLGGLPPGPFCLEASLEGQATIWRPCGLIGLEQEYTDLEIMMEPAGIVYGQVADQNGEAIKHALVTTGRPNRRRNRRSTPNPEVFHYNARGLNVLTEADGTFQLVGVPESQNWMVNVTHEEYKRTIETLEAGQIDIWVELSKGADLRGTIVDAAGVPVSQTQLWMLTAEGEPSKFSDFKGEYLFGGLDPLEKVYVIAYHPGYGMQLLGPMAIEQGMAPLDIVLDAGAVIAGVLVDANGDPVSGAAVRLQGALPEEGFISARLPEQFLGRNATLTDADGGFRFEELYSGVFTVTVSVPGKAKVIALGVEPGITPTLQLRLKD
ncbi:MAG: carboxypeptidase-like regulatory domain-containing protein [Planctomycetota bacterium]|nr:carboxypeptidase-like regulatory domain-containing protein [Planctomycetota bacterium]MDA1113541.1 carboxypeptidase-like regulatory domain-containing protein [Planctomycetota bacterium]